MKKFFLNIVTIFLCVIIAGVAKAQKENNKTEKKHIELKDVQSKEIAVDFPCQPNATVFLENILRRVTIKTSPDNKVRLVTTVYYQGNAAYSDEEWLEKLDLRISGTQSNVVVRSGNTKSTNISLSVKTVAGMSNGAKADSLGGKPEHKKIYVADATKSLAVIDVVGMPANRRPDTIANGIAVFDSAGNWVNRKSSIKRNVILYIPAGAALDIENKYADITLENNIKRLKITVTSGSLTMKNADELIVNSLFGNIYAEDVAVADIDLKNARFKASHIPALGIKSSTSFVTVNTINQLTINSTNDDYDLEELGAIKGSKNYGSLRVTTLKKSMDITGKNADIKVRSFDEAVGLVKIDNQYADLRLPLYGLKNYNVSFEGNGGNLYAPFERKNPNDNAFKTSVGNPAGSSPNFQLKCDNCTVDFK